MPQNQRWDSADRRRDPKKYLRTSTRERAGSISAIPFLCLLVSLIFVAASSASADDPGPSPAGLPTPQDVIGAIEAAGSDSVRWEPTDEEAAESLPHENLGREGAAELIQGVFEAQIKAPAGIFDELEVKKFLSPNVALIADEGPQSPVPSTVELKAPESDVEGEAVPAGPLSTKEELRAHSPLAPEEPEAAESDRVEVHGQLKNASLLDSTVPLRTESPSGEPEAVDLSLEHTEGEIQPVAPLVEVGIPQEIDEGIELPESGVTIKLEGAPQERATSIIDQSVGFAPNVATDTDLAVAPTPTGVETLTQLRSADSPHTETFTLDLPSGATLDATKGGGGAVNAGDETLVNVPPPTAIDASGARVPVSMEVSGDSLALTVSPSESAQLPILLDPLFQTYEWAGSKTYENGVCSNSFEAQISNPCNRREEWGSEIHDQAGTLPPPIHPENQFWGIFGLANGTPGLYIGSEGTVPAGDSGSWLYTVPRYFTDPEKYKDSQGHGETPTSFISHMTLWNLHWNAFSSHPSPYLFAGIWDADKQAWVSVYSHEGLNGHSLEDMGYHYQFANGAGSQQADTHAKVGYLTVQATESQSGQIADAYVGSASIELGDNDLPAVVMPSSPSQWINQTALPVPFTAGDSGLGVQSLTASTEQRAPNSNGPLYSWKTPYGCIGVGDAPCPRIWESTTAGHPSLKYEPALLPTGVDYLEVVAEDPVGNKSAPSYVPIKVDHTAPELSLSGPITEQASLGTMRGSYLLQLHAADGTAEHPQSGTIKAVVKIDGKVVDEMAPGCTTRNCEISHEWTLQSDSYSPGQHTIEVTATDAVGLATTKTMTIELQRAPAPSVSLSGTMTEQGSLGDTRPRYGLKVNASALAGMEGTPSELPVYESSFGSAGNGQFSLPGDVAVDPLGNLWVADTENNRIEKFNANGEYLSSFGSAGTGNGQLSRPTALAIDRKGNVWVADASNHRIEEFNSKGEYVAKVGSVGTGNVQFSEPEGIAIDQKGNVWVSDTYNGRLEEFNEKGEFVKVVGSYGSGTGQLGEPTGIDVGLGGNVWVADWQNNRVAEFNEAGGFIRQFGSSGVGEGHFAHPDAIMLDTAGHVWVADEGNERVEEFTEQGSYVAQFGFKGMGEGQFNFNYPIGIATDYKGDIWVTDSLNHRVQRRTIPNYVPVNQRSFGSEGTGTGQFNHPADVALDEKGQVWVVDKANNRIEEFSESGEFLSQFGSTGSGDGQFSVPTGLAIDPQGNIWVSDKGNNHIEKFNQSGEFLGQVGSKGSGSGQFTGPRGIDFDSKGNLWVVDSSNKRLEEFNAKGEFVRTVGSSGTQAGQFGTIYDLDVGPGDNVWVADYSNNRVEEFNEAGEFLRQFGSEGPGNGQFAFPSGVAVDSNGKVWVVDLGNNRVEEFNEAGEYISQFGSKGSSQGRLDLRT
jgi:streptogramin lyase